MDFVIDISELANDQINKNVPRSEKYFLETSFDFMSTKAKDIDGVGEVQYREG